MVVSGTSHQRGGIGGVQISCVLYLCKPLFQENTKGEAWLNPFCFLVWFLCLCARSRIHLSSLTRMCPGLFLCVLVYWRFSECGCWYVWTLHLVFPLSPSVRCQQHVRSAERPGIGLGAVVGGSNRAISQVPVQPTIPQGVSVNAEAHGVSAEEQGCLSKCIQCEGSC